MTKRTLGGFEPLFEAAARGDYQMPTDAEIHCALGGTMPLEETPPRPLALRSQGGRVVTINGQPRLLPEEYFLD